MRAVWALVGKPNPFLIGAPGILARRRTDEMELVRGERFVNAEILPFAARRAGPLRVNVGKRSQAALAFGLPWSR